MTPRMYFDRKGIAFLLIFYSCTLFPSIEDYYPYYLAPTSNNYGETGLLEIPTARFMEEGTQRMLSCLTQICEILDRHLLGQPPR